MMTDVLPKLAATVGWALFAVLLLFVSLRLFDFLDPINYQQEILKGNIAAGIKFAGVALAMAAIIVGVIVSP